MITILLIIFNVGAGKAQIRIGVWGMGVWWTSLLSVSRTRPLCTSRCATCISLHISISPHTANWARLGMICHLMACTSLHGSHGSGSPICSERWEWDDWSHNAGEHKRMHLSRALGLCAVNLFGILNRLDLAKEGELLCYRTQWPAPSISIHFGLKVAARHTIEKRRSSNPVPTCQPSMKRTRYVESNYVHSTESLNAGSGINRFRKCKSSGSWASIVGLVGGHDGGVPLRQIEAFIEK